MLLRWLAEGDGRGEGCYQNDWNKSSGKCCVQANTHSPVKYRKNKEIFHIKGKWCDYMIALNSDIRSDGWHESTRALHGDMCWENFTGYA